MFHDGLKFGCPPVLKGGCPTSLVALALPMHDTDDANMDDNGCNDYGDDAADVMMKRQPELMEGVMMAMMLVDDDNDEDGR